MLTERNRGMIAGYVESQRATANAVTPSPAALVGMAPLSAGSDVVFFGLTDEKTARFNGCRGVIRHSHRFNASRGRLLVASGTL